MTDNNKKILEDKIRGIVSNFLFDIDYQGLTQDLVMKANIALETQQLLSLFDEKLQEEREEAHKNIGKIKREAYQLGFKEGQQELIDQNQEEQRKLLQGFAYKPKDKKI